MGSRGPFAKGPLFFLFEEYRMRTFQYNELGHDAPLTITEAEILATYWDYWAAAMLKHGGLSPRITPDNCVYDFVVVFWAWELPPAEDAR
jgi:hypothetical protein